MPDAVSGFAARIASLTGPGNISFSAVNASSSTPEQFASFRKSLLHALEQSGVHTRQNAPAVSTVRVTLSENVRGLVYLAEVQQGPETRYAMAQAGRASASSGAASPLSLHRVLLAARQEPILDATEIRANGETKLLLLTAQAVVLYRANGAQWIEESSAPLTRTTPAPLDLRGHLTTGENGALDAYLPGSVCSVQVTDTLHATCRDADDAWPLGAQAAFFNGSANSFNGLLRPGFGRQFPPFYSAAAIPYPSFTLWVFAGVDGQVRTFDGSREAQFNARDWGSDLAAIHSGCGSGTQLIVTSAGGPAGNDTLRVMEIQERQPVAAAPDLDFPGPVTALWSAADAASAVAVVRNPRTESYEAYRVTLACH